MGEIFFSVFCGLFLAGTGLFLNWYLGREERNRGNPKKRRRE
jgi:hypothetical protein